MIFSSKNKNDFGTDITPEECKKIQLEILCYFRNMCDQHNIRYSLYAGTMLGAVRHKGFIPWDDDIDILMPREDYETLRTHYALWNQREYMQLHDYKTDPLYEFPFMKLSDERTVQLESRKKKREIGLHIDIFPLDGIPGGTYLSWLHIQACYFIKRCGLAANRNPYREREFSVSKKLVKALFKMATLGTPPRFFCYLGEYLATRFTWHDSFYASNTIWMGPLVHGVHKERIPAKYYEQEGELEFEGEHFHIIGIPHKILSIIYGDYMTPPPEHKRNSNVHVFGCWWKRGYVPEDSNERETP